eukprot:4922741-Amphidinium_carterae.1
MARLQHIGIVLITDCRTACALLTDLCSSCKCPGVMPALQARERERLGANRVCSIAQNLVIVPK